MYCITETFGLFNLEYNTSIKSWCFYFSLTRLNISPTLLRCFLSRNFHLGKKISWIFKRGWNTTKTISSWFISRFEIHINNLRTLTRLDSSAFISCKIRIQRKLTDAMSMIASTRTPKNIAINFAAVMSIEQVVAETKPKIYFGWRDTAL